MTRPQKPSPERDRLYAERNNTTLFPGAVFGCWLDRKSLKFLENGEMVLTLVVPQAHVEAALPVRCLTANPLPLVANLSVDPGFLGYQAATEERLKAL